MGNIGQAGAQMFTIPAVDPTASATQQPQGPPAQDQIAGTGAFPSGLENVKGITRDVYKKWAMLQNYAQTMWENHRINVVNPDFGNPAAMEAHDLFTQAMADTHYTVDALKNSEKLRQAILPQTLADPNQQFVKKPGEETTAASVKNMGATDRITVMNQLAQQVHRTESGKLATNTRLEGMTTEIEKELQEAIASGDGQLADAKQQELENAQMLRVAEVTPFAPQRDYGRDMDIKAFGKWEEAAAKIEPTYERWSELITGLSESYVFSDEITSSGGRYMESDIMNGMKLGDRNDVDDNGRAVRKDNTIRNILYDPTTGGIVVKFDAGKDAPFTVKNLTELINKYSESNNLGFKEAQINAYIDGKREYDQTDPSNPMVYIRKNMSDEDIENKYKGIEETYLETEKKANIKKEELSSIDTESWFSSVVTFGRKTEEFPTKRTDSKGNKVVVKVKRMGDGRFKLVNGKELSNLSDEREGYLFDEIWGNNEILEEEAIQNLLNKLGWFGMDNVDMKKVQTATEDTGQPTNVKGLKEVKGF